MIGAKNQLNIKTNKGFTLIEMLVAILVFSIIVGSISGIFVSGIREQRKTLSSQVLLDQASYALEYMSRALRMAKKQITGDPVCLSQSGTNYEITDGETKIKFINPLQGDDCQSFFLQDGKLKYQKDLDSTTPPDPLDLTSNDLEVTLLKFNFSGETQFDYFQPRATFYLEMEGKSSLGYQPKIKIQSSISQRMLDVEY